MSFIFSRISEKPLASGPMADIMLIMLLAKSRYVSQAWTGSGSSVERHCSVFEIWPRVTVQLSHP